MRLGFWQLEREDEKLALQTLYEQRAGQVPVDFSTSLNGYLQSEQENQKEELSFLPVRIKGQYDNQHHFYLDNRTHEGRVGFEVITPFLLAEGAVVFINRGWAPLGATRTDLPEIERINGEVEIAATIYVPVGEPFLLGAEISSTQWPRIIQSIDVNGMYETLGLAEDQQGLGFTLRIQEGYAGELLRNWQAINTTPEKHRAYAVQWFAMAAALLVLCLIRLFKDRKANSKREQQ